MNPLLAKLSSSEARAVRARGRRQVQYELAEVLRMRYLGPEFAQRLADLYYGLEYLRDNLPPLDTWRILRLSNDPNDRRPTTIAGFTTMQQADEYVATLREHYPEQRFDVGRGPVTIDMMIRPGFAAADYARFITCQ